MTALVAIYYNNPHHNFMYLSLAFASLGAFKLKGNFTVRGSL